MITPNVSSATTSQRALRLADTATSTLELVMPGLPPLPVGDRTIGPEVGLRTSGHGLGNLGDLRELLVVQLHTQTRPLIRIQFALFEIEADRQVGQRAALVVVLHENGS